MHRWVRYWSTEKIDFHKMMIGGAMGRCIRRRVWITRGREEGKSRDQTVWRRDMRWTSQTQFSQPKCSHAWWPPSGLPSFCLSSHSPPVLMSLAGQAMLWYTLYNLLPTGHDSFFPSSTPNFGLLHSGQELLVSFIFIFEDVFWTHTREQKLMWITVFQTLCKS